MDTVKQTVLGLMVSLSLSSCLARSPAPAGAARAADTAAARGAVLTAIECHDTDIICRVLDSAAEGVAA